MRRIGTIGPDNLLGTSEDDILKGLKGNDVLRGLKGDDLLFGGDGNDTIYAGGGNDKVIGGEGNDFLYKILSGKTTAVNFSYTNPEVGKIQGIESVYLSTGLGNDTIISTAAANTIYSNDGNDWIMTGAGRDSINSGAGDDYISSGAGDDQIDAGKGNDTVIGGAGNDSLYKDFSDQTTGINFSYTNPEVGNIQGIEAVTLSTGSGDDTIVLTAAEGYLYHKNYIYSNDGNNSITTGAGNEQIISGAGDDYISSGAGDDYISSGTGNDTVIGGAGNDHLYKDFSDQTTGINFSYTDPNVGNIQGIESLHLSTGSGDDTIVSTAAVSLFSVYSNYISSNGGNDSITTGAGDDIIYAGTGDDTVIGGEGNDYLGKSFSDLTTAVNFSYTDPNSGKIQGIERLYLSTGSGDDTIVSTAAVGFSDYSANEIYSNGGNDSITTSAGNDYINSGAGNDGIDAGTGDDTVIGGEGNDYLTKDFSNLTRAVNFSYTDPNSGKIQGIERLYLSTGAGDDTIVSAAVGFSNYSANEIYSNEGNDSITTSAGDDFISSGAGNDSITTGAGDDDIYSGAGNDLIKTGAGNDGIIAGEGNDTLIGGLGNDKLTGNSGQDQFVFNTPTEGIDRIYDFSLIDDKIAVSRSGFSNDLIAGAAITVAQFTIDSVATTASQRFIYNSASGALFFDADGVGSTAAIQFATLDSGLALTNADIFVTP
ncbi:hypothetical protein C7H19_13375 [Aphanothece hegewaldii CCALA 016]|uniref:Calcium-binding protein n=1 Tax=Aphanothece hegewaldii CCALA 016 TaxID=2107694 RepID=A0A2T1LWY2_9CHRO|nr:calcium-binding protein [Aphanothece hegewaldii]PSF36662.1 hypothetical protein C7H19_13375 [Aphanothece hegewaldii CCALA 016]